MTDLTITLTDILDGAATIVAESWTTGAEARDENEAGVLATDPRARYWCAAGAIIKVCWKDRNRNHGGVDRTVEDVLQFDAIKLAANEVREQYPDYDYANPHSSDVLLTFNDEIAESADEVAEMLRSAARRRSQ